MRVMLPFAVVGMLLGWGIDAAAQPPPQPVPTTDPSVPAAGPTAAATQDRTPAEIANDRLVRDMEKALPPPSHVVYFQYGVAFTTEQVASPGPVCDNLTIPCVLGGGGGIIIRGGWRSSGPLYIGGAYEITKQDANKLYRLALLQQARAEGRYYFPTARVTEPYLSASLGVAGYGNEWAVDSFGPAASLGAGFEYQISKRTLVGLALNYRLVYLTGFTDTAGSVRDGGIAQLVGLDLVLEQRDAILTAGKGSGSP